jgi:outer membrane lipoprotein
VKKKVCAIILFLFVSSGCASIISKELRKNVSNELTLKEIIKEPDAHKGKIVLISGVILGSRNTREGTLIEILQKPADMAGRPKDVDESDGRFLALNDGYLDTVIYARGREALVAGEIKGIRTLPLDEIEYDYPLVIIREIHLFKPKKEKRFYTYPCYPYWYYPPRWYYPYWYP